MIEHTTGPWAAHAQPTANHYIILKDNHWVAAIQFNGEQMLAKQAANARLIAAAPELLAALIETLAAGIDWFDDSTGGDPGKLEWVQRARATITKATGEAA